MASWQKCILCLKSELPAQQFNTWIRPIRAVAQGKTLRLLAPNRFILDWVRDQYQGRIAEFLRGAAPELGLEFAIADPAQLELGVLAEEVLTRRWAESTEVISSASPSEMARVPQTQQASPAEEPPRFAIRTQDSEPAVTEVAAPAMRRQRKLSYRGELNQNYTFTNFVQGKSNQLARAAAAQVANNPGGAYNPLFIYGGVGLGKTHLMHAIGNQIQEKDPSANVVYLHSQTFVGSMVSALQLNAINEFKRYYHTVDVLLIDDIQFFANKERSQEEFFHTFNAIFDGGRQIIMTCDKYHSEINGLDDRLKSRFGWGLAVAVEAPDLETRAAILKNKADQENVGLGNTEAMFMAQKLRSNVRELEGALKKVIAHSNFLGADISVSLIKDALKDLLALQSKLVSVDNIQRTVAEYYKIKMADMISKRRNRSVARPRQIAMSLSKELTNHSLPEIGSLYGGRDHTTVLHACRTISDLRKTSSDIEEDYQNLLRSLSS
jgi:chromosomal replication initiator protein